MEEENKTTQTTDVPGEAIKTETTAPVETTTDKPETTAKPGGEPEDNASDKEPKGEGGDSKEDVDYKAKFTNSTTENQRYREALKENGIDPDTFKAVVDKTSDEYVKTKVEGFDLLSSAEQEKVRELVINKEDLNDLKVFKATIEDKEKYETEFNELVLQDDFKSIGDKSDEFRKFAYTKENKNTPLTILAKAFLFGNQPTEAKPKRKGNEAPSGGEKSPANPGGKTQMSAEESATLRKSQPRKWNKLVQSGKLEITD